MKRIACILMLTVITVMSLTACGDPSATEATDAPTVGVTESSPTESVGEMDLKAFIASFDTEPTLEESVIYEDQGVTVTAEGITYDLITGPVLTLSAVNTGEEPVVIQSGLFAVNGYMLNASLTLACPAGKSAEGRIELSYRGLALAGISAVERMEFSLRVMDGDGVEQLAASAPIILTTTADSVSPMPADDSGQKVYDGGGVTISLKGIDERRMYSDGAALIVSMENSTDRNISIQTGEVKVNGYDFTSAMSTGILPGKKAMDTVTFFDMDMQEYGISEIDSAELSFKIIDAATWKTIDETEMIAVEISTEEEE